MTADDDPALIRWGENELAITANVLAHHGQDRYGLCKCGRVWECNVYFAWCAYQRLWLARFSIMNRTPEVASAPTMFMPQLKPRRLRLPGRGFFSAPEEPAPGLSGGMASPQVSSHPAA